MPAPDGKIIVICGIRADGSLHAVELSDLDSLKVYVEGGEVTVTAHALLDGTVNNDTVANAPTRGSLIKGNATPKWDELVLGADNSVLASDGSDLAYETLASLIKAALLTADGDILIRSGGTVQRLAKGNDDEVLTLASGVPSWAVGGGAGLYESYVHVNDEKAQNTDGGTFTLGAWRTRDINQEKSDADGICSIASNQITLDAGTYRCFITCPASYVGRHQAQLYDTTGSAVLLLGTSSFVPTAVVVTQGIATVQGRFTIASQSVLEVQHQSQATRATTGFGLACNFGVEVYTQAEFWKEA